LALDWNDPHAGYKSRLVPQLPCVKIIIVGGAQNHKMVNTVGIRVECAVENRHHHMPVKRTANRQNGRLAVQTMPIDP
jgi:hypothetical protein